MLDYDFSLLELASSIDLDSITKAPIVMAEPTDLIADDSVVLVSGWGDTLNVNESPDFLRAVFVNIVNYEKCEEIYKNDGGVTDRMICAKTMNKDSCQG